MDNLIHAIQTGDITKVEALVRLGADPNGMDANGKPVLVYAIITHNIEMVKTLVRLGADVNMPDDNSYTPLMTCIRSYYDRVKKKIVSNIGMIDTLIKLGADVNAQTEEGTTALILALGARDYIQQVVMLLQAGAGRTINVAGSEGETALMTFVSIGHPEHLDEYLYMITLLVEHGADINLQDEYGNTAGMHALSNDNLVATEALIQKGADITIRNHEGQNMEEILNPNGTANRYIGQLEGYGDQNAPYQIKQSQEFVTYTQYRPIKPEDNEELRIILENVPKPHLVYACASGHLHWSEDCGVPTEVEQCSRDTTPEGGDGPCTMLVGGMNHLLCPGSYVVYHDNEDNSVSKIWFGTFPAYTYPTYLQMIKQYNMAVEWARDNRVVVLPLLEQSVVEEINDIAEKINSDKYEEGKYEEFIVKQGGCPICGEDFNEKMPYYLLKCGHVMCENCVKHSRQGNIENINVGSYRDISSRKCGICSKHFRFGSIQRIKLYKFTTKQKSSCTIS